MRILLVGHGKMGHMVEGLAGDYGCEVAGYLDPHDPAGQDGPESERWQGVDVALGFWFPDGVVKNVPVLARRGISMVVGTTGWQKDEAVVRRAVADTGVGIVVAPNFSTGVVLFEALVARASALFAPHGEFGAWVHEAYHNPSKYAPTDHAVLFKSTTEKATVS